VLGFFRLIRRSGGLAGVPSVVVFTEDSEVVLLAGVEFLGQPGPKSPA